MVSLFVMEHIGWKPGIDSTLNVWTTRWVGGERPEPRTIWLDQENAHLANLQVRNLLHSNGSWNEEFIQDLFTNEWATRILAIPRCEVRAGGKVYWPHTTSGMYTVKSGYGLIFEDFMDKAGTAKDRSRLNFRGRMFCQKVLWKLPVPQMWKVLLWRIITNALPIGYEFAKRKIEVDDSCSMCIGEPKKTWKPWSTFLGTVVSHVEYGQARI
ncbi:uncharacterized protein LOC141601246 [Silene latifolia]|uniref:uncharacterized protein LOC141601246 n=1 Tax=Silene latifolia TaxID=37657 RepID=UPI003D78085E